MRLIDADRLKGTIAGATPLKLWMKRTPAKAMDAMYETTEIIDKEPTIDAVPIVQRERMVELINDLIDNAVHHGADCGGPYFTNEEGLIESARNLLDALNLNGQCAVKKLPGWHDSWSDIAVTAESE